MGTHLLPRLLAEDATNSVTVLDNLGKTANPEQISTPELRSRVRLIEGDVRSPQLVAAAMAGSEIVIHLAAETYVDRSIECPTVFAEVNVSGTLNVLNAATEAHVRRFIHVSTDEVWGHLTGEGQFTEDSPYRPRNPYSASKAASDHFVTAWGETWGIDYVIVYFTNLYGPYQYPEKFVPRSIARLKAGLSVTLYGDGSNIRTWLHIEDAAHGLLAAGRFGRPGRKYIIGSEDEYTNLEIAHLMIAAAGRDPSNSIEFVADRPGHDFRYAVDCSRARRELNWVPSKTLPVGIIETVNWYLEQSDWLSTRSGAIRVRSGAGAVQH